MADYPGQAHHHQQQHLSHHQQQQQHYEQQMRQQQQQQQQQQYTLQQQQQQHSMAAMQHAQSQHMQQIHMQQQQHQQSPQMLAHAMNTTNTSPPNMAQRPTGHPQMQQQQHNNLLHQQVQQQSRQISNSPQHMLHQQQTSHLTPPSPAHRQQQTPPNSQQQQQYSQGNPGQMVRQPQYIQFARPGTSVYSNQAAGGGSNAAQGNVLHQPQPLPKQLQKPGSTVVTVHSQQPGVSPMQLGPQRVLTQQPIQYRPQPVGVGRSQPVRYAYIQSDGSVQPINQESDRPVQIVSQIHPMQLQYQQGPPMGQQPQGSALRQALVQDGRHPNGMIAQQRPMAQSSMANMTPHNVVLVSANGQQQALNSVVVSGSPSIASAMYIDGSSLDSSSANVVNNQGDSSAESSPPDSNPNQLSKPSITARNRPKSKSPSKMGMAGPSGKPMPSGAKPVFGKPVLGRMSGGKPVMSNGISSLSGYSHGANNGLIYGNAANMASKALMNKGELEKLVKNVDGYTTLEDDVSEAVLLLLDDFVDEVIQGSAALSKHRGSKRLETKDVRYLLKHKFDMSLPPDAKTPLGGEDGAQSSKAIGPPVKRPALDIHRQRLALIDKSLKKL